MPKAVAEGLRLRGRDVTTTNEVGLLGASDPEQLSFAHKNGRVIVTQDDDLLTLAAEGSEHSGIVFWTAKRAMGQLIKELDALCYELSAKDMLGQIRFL
ncbi:DUF5615 family PIN-like protein [Rubripirellula obstinata]|nr:DUF5615 family PIN-like protein [Rubripirellula obstinata]